MVTLSSEALYMWYRLVRPSDASRTLVANIDDDHIDIDIIDNSRLVFTRGLICDDGSPASDAKLVSEIELSAATYRKESSRGLDRISLTGSPERAEKLKPLLSHQMKVPVDVMDQADGPGVKMPEEARRSGASFVELLGISLGPEPARVNLSSEESRDEERAALSRRSLAATLTLAVLVLALSCGVVAKKFMDKYACLNSIDSEMKKISTDLGRAKKMASDLALVKAEMERRPLAVDVLGEVCQSTPPGIALNMLDYDSGKALAIRGTAPALGDVFGYVTALEASRYFGGVKVKYANKRVVSGRELAEFEIGCLIKKDK
jgi:hypothetical protein